MEAPTAKGKALKSVTVPILLAERLTFGTYVKCHVRGVRQQIVKLGTGKGTLANVTLPADKSCSTQRARDLEGRDQHNRFEEIPEVFEPPTGGGGFHALSLAFHSKDPAGAIQNLLPA